MVPGAHEVPPTRPSLLRKARNLEDQDSWQDLYDIYSKMISRAAVRAGLNEWEAQEVLQETMIRLAKKLPQFEYDRKVGSFRGWLMRTTRWGINDQFRRRGLLARRSTDRGTRTGRTATVARIPDPRGDVLEEHWEREWKESVLEAALEHVKASVSPPQFQIFDCYVLKQWQVEKVARILGVSPASVYLAKSRIQPLVEKEVRRLKRNTN